MSNFSTLTMKTVENETLMSDPTETIGITTGGYDVTTAFYNVTSNVTSNATSAPAGLEVFGLGTYVFDAIHVTAMLTCGTSTVVSAALLIYLARNRKLPFFECTVGERLVVYLSICDLGFSISHGADHVVMYSLKNHTPQPACTVIAYVVQEFTLGQSLVVNIAAITAIIVVVRERRANFGKYDWKLITYAFGFPAVLGIFIGALGYMGAVGAWCFMDVTQHVGRVLNTFYILAMILVFAINTLCYMAVFIKIQRVGAMLAGLDDKSASNAARRARRSAQSMAAIVLAYLFQWCLYVTFTLWSFFGVPHVGVLIADVFVCNLGGVFNVLAYTAIKKRYEANDAKKRSKEPKSLATSTTSVTSAASTTDLSNQPKI